MNDQSLEQRKWSSQEAKQLLDNKHFKQAFDSVEGYLVDNAHMCDPDNKDKAQRIVISMQLLQAIKREIIRKIEDGEMAEVQIAELEKRKGLLRFIR